MRKAPSAITLARVIRAETSPRNPTRRRAAPTGRELASPGILPEFQPLPRWTVCESQQRLAPGLAPARDLEDPAAAAAFAAGAALFALDQVVRADPPWLGAFRMRQALAAAATSARLLRLREDEAALRDAHHLTRPSDDPGPAGRLYRAWRLLATRPARLEATALERFAKGVGLAPTPFDLTEAARGSPIAAAAEIAVSLSTQSAPGQRLEAEVLGLMLADVALAQKLGWAAPVPLLATVILHPALRIGPEGRRASPGDPGWAVACQAAYAKAAAEAHARALDLARRADRLAAAARTVRTRGGATGIAALLAEDAVAATGLTSLGSDRAGRRFLERLVGLGVIRELTRRPVFRLYGL